MALRLDQTRRAGLELALRQLADRSTVPGGVTCTFEGGGIATGLKPEHEHELLRIAQEAVSNAVRHARPPWCASRMADETAHWVLAVAGRRRGMEQRPGAVCAGGLRAHEHAPARRRHRRGMADRQPARRAARGSACACRSARQRLMVAVIKKARSAYAGGRSPGSARRARRHGQSAGGHGGGRGGRRRRGGDRALRAASPDVLVLDLRMPKRDGVAVVQRVLEINPKACILIMTTYDGDEDIFQCLCQGAKGYLLKDAPRQEILSAIRAVSEDRPYTSSSVAPRRCSAWPSRA